MKHLKAWLLSHVPFLEKHLRTDVVYLTKSGFWLTISQIISALASFILAIAFAHLISKEVYGTYKYIFAVVGVITSLSLTGLPTAITNAAAKNMDGTLLHGFKRNIIWSIPMLLIFAATGIYYITQGNISLAIGLMIVGFITPFLASASLSDAFLIGKKDFRRSAVTTGLATIIVSLATILAAYFSGNIIVLVTTFISTSLIVELIIYWYTSRVYHANDLIDETAIKYGAHLSLMGVIGTVVDKMDSILTFHFLGATQLAIYSFAVAIPEQIKGLAKNIGAIAQPKFSNGNKELIKKIIGHKILVFSGGMILITIFYIICAPLIFKFLFPQYTGEAVFVSQIFSISLFSTANMLPVAFLQAVADKKSLYYFNISGSIVQMICIAVGVYWGILGIVIGTSVSRLFRLVFSYILVKNSKV